MINNEIKNQELLEPVEVAKILGVKVSLLTNWRHHKKGPSYFKIGKQIRYSRESVNNFLKNGFVKVNKEK